ncbi:MAG TPA: DUF4118 domain-containing protein [Rhodospirillaceae bacterium]|nr:DUF4118 domain-containing protein [Rhodospirillaceae bacterium]
MKALLRSFLAGTIDLQRSTAWPARYLFGLVMTMIAFELRLQIAGQGDGIPYVTFFPAATLTAILCGFWPGILATLAGATLAVVFFMEPFGEIKVTATALVSALVFCLDEIVVCSAIEGMRRYYHKYVEAARDLRQALARAETAQREAERANGAKSRILASVSHDLRQPWQALRLYSDTCKSRCQAAGTGNLLTAMDQALTNGESLLRSLADHSVLDAGLIEARPVAVSTTRLMQSVLSNLQPLAEAKGLRLRVNIQPKIIVVDPTLFGRLIGNLADNAVKFTRSGDILLGCRSLGGGTLFVVKDTGIGIPTDHQDQVFEEFFQIDNDERDYTKGLGLGLSTARKLAGILRVGLRLRSRPGKGTVVAVMIPDTTALMAPAHVHQRERGMIRQNHGTVATMIGGRAPRRWSPNWWKSGFSRSTAPTGP